ncbi:glutamate synthase, partial [bacterium]
MESAGRLDFNHQLSLSDLPYVIAWNNERCTRCGRCTSVCPVKAIEPGVMEQRLVASTGSTPLPSTIRKVTSCVKQATDIGRRCIGCATCRLVCPNDAIEPVFNSANKYHWHANKGGEPVKRGGRRNDPDVSVLDKLKFTRISMLTDPALDAGRHEFRVRTLLGRSLPPEELPLKLTGDGLIPDGMAFVPPVREIFPIRIGGMSVGALSPTMWEGLAMGIAYLNEVEKIPVVMCTGEGGMPPRLLKSPYLKYFILQIAS